MKTLLNFRFGKSSWTLSFGEYICLVLAVFCGWFAGCVTAPETVAARSAPTNPTANPTDAPPIHPVNHRSLAAE